MVRSIKPLRKGSWPNMRTLELCRKFFLSKAENRIYDIATLSEAALPEIKRINVDDRVLNNFSHVYNIIPMIKL